MKYYKDPETGKVYAYEDDAGKYIRDGLKPMSQEDLDALKAKNEAAARISAIQSALSDIDAKTIRPLRAGEIGRVAELEAEAKKLREEMKEHLKGKNNEHTG